MFEQVRWQRVAWLPVAAGLLWLWCAARLGVVGFVVAAVPGCLLLASGVSTLLYPGDARIPQFVALGGVIGTGLALPALAVLSWAHGVPLALLSAAAFVAAGAISVRQEPHVADVPTPRPSLGLAAQVAIDDAILATLTLRLPPMLSREQGRLQEEIDATRALFRERGWLADPAAYHRAPPPPEVQVGAARAHRLAYEHVRFESGYAPEPGEPGRERWLAREANRTAHAWVLRHRGEPRPWLLCIHGYEMGAPGIDLAAFQAARLHYRHGLNLALPVLPLHGPRKLGRHSGEGFLAGDFVDSVHAEAQAMWDLRRLLRWIRGQGAPAVGVYGLSLGGYNAALLAALEELACVIAGIPAVDFARLTWRHGAPLAMRYAQYHGLMHDDVHELLTVISPLAIAPRVPHAHRYIFAGVADRIVPAEQPRDLWRHWQRPRIVWYQGAHVTFRAHREVDQLIMDALRAAALIGRCGVTFRAGVPGMRRLDGQHSRADEVEVAERARDTQIEAATPSGRPRRSGPPPGHPSVAERSASGEAAVWNVLVTAHEGEQRPVRRALRRLVRLRASGYRNVLIGCVDDVEGLLAAVAELLERRKLHPHQLGRVLPIERIFAVDAASFDAQLRSESAPFLPRLARRRFHVRIERRGHKGVINTVASEQALGEYLHGELERRGESAGVAFHDPDAVLAVELIGDAGGIGLVTRELQQRFPFVKID